MNARTFKLSILIKNLSLFATFLILTALGCTAKKENSQITSAENAKKTVHLFIWSNYITDDLLKEFENKTGIKVVVSNFASNEELLAKLQAGATGYDVIVPSDYMVEIMRKLKLIEPINKMWLSNFPLLEPKFLNQKFDPDNLHSVPYAWSTTGIAVNRKLYKGPLAGWNDFFTQASLTGKISVLDDTREVFTAALKVLGYSSNTKNKEEIKKAQEYLVKNKKQIKAFIADPMEAMTSGEVLAAQMYSVDALQAARSTKGDIEYILPVEGGTIAIDNLAIPVGSKNLKEAHELINFMIEPSTSAKLVVEMFNGPVVKGVQNNLPGELKANASLFPEESKIKSFEMLVDLEDLTTYFDRLWTELKSK